MVNLYLVISPNGNIAYAGQDLEHASTFKPAWDLDTGLLIREGYELYTVKADTPWLTEREENSRARRAAP